jgi:hypothetical protein
MTTRINWRNYGLFGVVLFGWWAACFKLLEPRIGDLSSIAVFSTGYVVILICFALKFPITQRSDR